MWRVEWNRGCNPYIVAANQGRVLAIDNTLDIGVSELHLWPAHYLVVGHSIRSIQQYYHECCSVDIILARFVHRSHQP